MNTDDTQPDFSQPETDPDLPATPVHRLGTLGLLFGAAIVVLAFMDATSGIPFQMPSSWYVNRSIWYFLGLLGFVVGSLLLKDRPQVAEEPESLRVDSPFQRLVFYTRQDCHLCDDAKEILLRYETSLPELEEIDIDNAPDLVEEFGRCVPVVEIDGKVRFRGCINEMLLRRLIEGAS